MQEFRNVDPGELRLPSSRRSGADWAKLQRQIVRFGTATATMPPIWVRQGSDGVLLILDGVTRATRIAKLVPGVLVPVVIVDVGMQPYSMLPMVRDNLP